MGINSKWDDEECSVIGEKGEVGFIDYEDDASVCSYNPSEEGPVIISAPFRFEGGKPRSVFVGETVADSITIRNTTREPVELWATKIYASTPENSFTLSLMEPPSKDSDAKYIKSFVDFFTLEDRILQPGELLTVWLSCKPKEIGVHTSIVHFDLGDNTIERVVFLLGEDKISQSLAANKPYARGAKKKNHFVVEAPVRGVPPSRTNTQRGYTRSRLPWYNIPKNVRELVEDKHIPDPVREGLTIDNYSSYFKHLLYMEEIHLEEDMRAYDMECVSMRRKGPLYLTLQVPGLAERRPSLVHGDHIFVKLAAEAADNTSPSYEGYIHRVEADEVYLRFAHDFHFHHRDTELYNVQFTYDRVNMRRMYQAVDAAKKLEMEFLFPSSSAKIRLISTNPIVPISCNLNEEQILSLEMILGCNGGPPFVIYGPPGTGKTVTLVEAILQLYTTREDARIFVCASSNSAADHILEKLLCEKAVNIKEKEVFRLNAASRSLEDCNPDHIRFCFFEDFIFKCPPIKALMRYRIIISTYMSASSLFAEGVRSGHFSHIFLDEAGQASEPETMIPISNLTQRETVVVLAGDPKQLGPVIYSKDAESYGLGKSYLERLFECEFYYTGNENYVTKLVRNYRSHPEILRLPSKLFYEGELIACKDDVLGSPMPSVKFLPNKEFPVLFVGIQGCDEREGSNPSWFNRIEASKVVEMIKKLIGSGNFNEEDIGVITPYRQQVLKIRTALERDEIADIKVGSVEQFQGQEKEVIIISSVRSTVKHNEFDKTFCLGFLSNPRRFNVAITRARSLLIIIGNPHIVSKDRYWNELLWHCSDNGSYQGCVLPDRQEYLDDYPTEQDGYNNEENSQLSNGAEWGQEFSQAEWGEKPVKGNWGQESSQAEWGEKPVEGNWGQESSQAESGKKPVEGNWGQESSQAEWGEKPVKGNWGQESSQAEWGEKPVEGNWGQESSPAEWSEKPVKGDWAQESTQPEWSKKPLKGDWGQESYQTKKWSKKPAEGNWTQKSYQSEWSEKPVIGDWGQESYQAEWSERPVKGEWGQGSSEAEWNAKAVKDESQWDDGWK